MASIYAPIVPPGTPRITKPGAIAATVNARRGGGTAGEGKRPWFAPLFRMVLGEGTGSEEAEVAAAVEKGERKMVIRSSGRLTAEKARVLRREMRAMENWHDAMYHSAIASRLASPEQL